ncbi:MAG: hypothetical protein AVDCRST_MAG68-872, partial [uncultured Gemmatimonadetes bacterium]
GNCTPVRAGHDGGLGARVRGLRDQPAGVPGAPRALHGAHRGGHAAAGAHDGRRDHHARSGAGRAGAGRERDADPSGGDDVGPGGARRGRREGARVPGGGRAGGGHLRRDVRARPARDFGRPPAHEQRAGVPGGGARLRGARALRGRARVPRRRPDHGVRQRTRGVRPPHLRAAGGVRAARAGGVVLALRQGRSGRLLRVGSGRSGV